jgi:hypothetical protein
MTASNSTDSGEQLCSDSPGSDSDEDDSLAQVSLAEVCCHLRPLITTLPAIQKSKESSDYNLATASEESGAI